MSDQSLLETILNFHGIEYATTDTAGRVLSYSPGFTRWIENGRDDVVYGRNLTTLFDELAGLEDEIAQLSNQSQPALKIEKILRQEPGGTNAYITLGITPHQDGLLLLVTDVTDEGKLEQRVTQQRNELTLLSNQLDATRAQLDDLLHRFLPGTVADQMVANPKAVKLGGERKLVTILFADLRGFTSWTEGVDPETALHMLNGKLSIAVEALIDHGGTLDKFMGDAVMGVFNTPLADPDHALHAVQAAWQLIRALKYDPVLQFSVGINTGVAVAGNIGTAQAMNYTVIGDAVNQAKRLQEMAKPGQVLISGATQALLPDEVGLLSLGGFQLRGRSQDTKIYAVTGLD
jgi:class 3 adenylate cyclase